MLQQNMLGVLSMIRIRIGFIGQVEVLIVTSLAKRKDQLHHILNDNDYWSDDTGFKSFLQDQYNNLERGWTLSDKQEAVTKAVKRYAVYFFKKNDPVYKQKIDDKIARINVIKSY